MAILAKLQEDDGVTLKPSHNCLFYENVVNKNPQNAQQKEGDCIFCGRKVPSTGPYRWVTHMINCAGSSTILDDGLMDMVGPWYSKSASPQLVAYFTTVCTAYVFTTTSHWW